MGEFIFREKIIRSPEDIRQLPKSELSDLCKHLRTYVSGIPTDKKAHLESSLGVTELTVALHYILDTPHDKVIWDVGHQTAVHKVLTGRGASMYESLRKLNGISGFPSPDESPFDLFFTGHSSTSISLALGLWLAGLDHKIVAVIGDGALTGGQAFEALNLAGDFNANILIVLNDNGYSIDKNVGALETYDTYPYFFRALNFKYYGPVDGNDIDALIPAITTAIRDTGPKVLHVRTRIERIYSNPSTTKYNFKIRTAVKETVLEYLAEDQNLFLLSPAMLSGIGLSAFKAEFSGRIIDTGITEQSCVSIAAALAKSGKKVIVHIYSTFLQRAVDQIIHDVALQNLPVLFLVDRAGLVGEDGPTHHGLFDVPVLSAIPRMEIRFPNSTRQIKSILAHWHYQPRLIAVRIPRDSEAINMDVEIPQEVWTDAPVSIVSVGTMAHQAYKAFKKLSDEGFNLNFFSMTMYPLGSESIMRIKLLTQKKVFLIEEAYRAGSISEKVISGLVAESQSKKLPECECIHLPHEFITHGSPEELLHLTALSADKLYDHIKSKLSE